MHELTLAVVFGSPGEAIGWATQESVDQLPPLGMRASFRFGERDSIGTVSGEVSWEEVTHAQVVFAGENTAGECLAFLYGGPGAPSAEFVSYMEAAEWTPLDAPSAEEVMQVCAAAPPMAAVQDVLLLVGEPAHPGFQAWRRAAIPTDPVLPVFGQRVLLDAVEGVAEEPPEDTEEEAVPGFPGTAAGGVVVVTVDSRPAEPGYANVAFWTPRMGEIDGLSLVSAGWEQLVLPAGFDPESFRLERRIDLAMRTRITVALDDQGLERVVDVDMAGAGDVDPADFDLLPPALALHCHAAAEMRALDEVLQQWSDAQQSGDGPVPPR